ncbi:uncharacterized protein LOC124667270 isoform X3 [Lolium rigidum]|nr:uncharacterized protein LOC124667270 isoform X3 [Lolium rigidum]
MAELLSRDPAALRPAATTAWMRPTTERVQLDPAAGGSAVRCAAERAVARERRRHGRRVRERSTRKFGDNFPVGYTRDRCASSYDADFVLSGMDSLSPSDKENIYPSRNRFLDDALFQFFRKEAIKSLKRDFTDFCNGSELWSQSKRAKGHEIGRDSFISYSIKYYWEVLKCLTDHRKEVIRKFGFGCLLLFEKSEIPSPFVRWLASCVDPVSSQIIVDDSKIIPISKSSVHFVTGLPNSGFVPLPNCEGGVKFLLSLFHLSELPHITFFGNKLKSKEVLSDKEIFVCFMVVAFKCLLFPTCDEFPNTDFLLILDEPDATKGFDICELVYDHLIAGIYKFLKICKMSGRKPREFEFCYYFLAVYYLDSLDFGARKLDDCVPRISVWKGNLIKFFSTLDFKKNNIFGKRQFKKFLAPCYREFGLTGVLETVVDGSKVSSEPSCFSVIFKQNLHKKFGHDLDAKIIDRVIDSVWSLEIANHDVAHKSELLVTTVLQLLLEMKFSEVKIPTSSNTNVPAFEGGKCNVPGTCNENNMVTDDLPNASSSSKPIPLKYASPECLVTEIDVPYSTKTAPEMNPLRKVKARLHPEITVGHHLRSVNTYPSGGKESRQFIVPDDSKVIGNQLKSIGGYVVGSKGSSPISLFKLPQTPNNKQPDVPKNLSGSRHDPIPVCDISPKANNIDDLYNKLCFAGNNGVDVTASKMDSGVKAEDLIDLTENVFDQRNANDGLIILQPKNTLSLPLVQNKRFPVSHSDITNFCAIVDLAYTRVVQKSYSVIYDKVHCSYISLGQSLMVEGHIDNFLVPVFCRKLFEDNHPSKSGRHHFFSFIGENILDYNNDVQLNLISKAFLGAASASRGRRLDLSDRLFFPICRSRHWFTFSVDFKYKVFIFLDSLFGKDDDYHTSIKNVLINNFVKLWKIIFKTDDNIFRNFGIMYPNFPKQVNA